MDLSNIISNPSELLEKIKEYGKIAGRAGASMALHLYYVMVSPQTSMLNKTIIAAALAYQFLPKQLLSRERNGVLGITDNVVTLAIAYNRVKANITPEVTANVEAKLFEWGL